MVIVMKTTLKGIHTMPPARKNVPAKAVRPASVALQPTSSTPVDESELTPEQIEIRDLKDKLAKSEGAKDPETEYDTVSSPGDEKNILIHFVSDGFCDLGAIWYRGQELELEPGTAQYEEAKKWASLDSSEQEEIYGRVYFRQGPWKGKDYEDASAAKAERSRNRAAPRINR